MRRLALASALLLSACATREVAPPAPTPVPPAPVAREQGQLIGRTTAELVGLFGTPVLQIREGASLKLQFRSPSCVLDAYLYPSTGQQLRVTHVDARSRAGGDVDQAACIEALSGPN